MKNKNKAYAYGPYLLGQGMMENLDFLGRMEEDFSRYEPSSYDILLSYSSVFNLYTASSPQPNPFSNKVMFIIDALNKMGVKYSLDIFSYEGGNLHWSGSLNASHKLVNIIAEPNPNAIGPAVIFCAHHDVANVRSENCQDNGASVCNLLQLASKIKNSQEESKRTIILFTDSEESGARGAKRFVTQHLANKAYGEIESIINLELTGKGNVVWSDCETENDLHKSLETVLGKTIPKFSTPPSDAKVFRRYGYPVLCIGILPEDDLTSKETWRICHSMKDIIDGCNRNDMKDFTEFLLDITKNQTKPNDDGNNNGVDEAKEPLST